MKAVLHGFEQGVGFGLALLVLAVPVGFALAALAARGLSRRRQRGRA